MPEPDDDVPGAPGASQASAKQGVGCLWLLVLVPIALIGGIIVGGLLASDDEEGELQTRLAEGAAGGSEWFVNAERDIQGNRCAFLYLDDEKLTGACTTAPQDASLDDGDSLEDRLTVVFGLAPRQATEVRVGLRVDGGPIVDPIDVETVTADPVEGRFYVAEVRGDLDVTGTIEVLAEDR